MAVREIVQLGIPVLTGSMSDVSNIDANVLNTIRDLKDTLNAHKIAVGLAAPQIGVPLKIAVLNLKTPGFEDIVLINPKVVSETGKRDKKKESCMSLRNKRGDVVRREKLTVNYVDESGKDRLLEASKFLARVLAHEIDHLAGILYTTRMDAGSSLETVDFDAWEADSKRDSTFKAN